MRVVTTSPAVARRRPASGLLCLVMSGLLWGTGGLTGRLLGRAAGLSALPVAAYRLTAGGALIVAFLAVTGRRWPAGRAAWTRIAVIGLLAAQFQGCYFTAVSLTSVSLATLVTIGSAPVIVLCAERVAGRRRTSRLKAGAACLALAGLGLLAGVPTGGFPASAVLASAGMAVLAASGFAALTLLGRRPVPGLEDQAATGFGFAAGGLALMALSLAAGDGLGFRPGPAAIGLLIALGTGPTAMAYTLYFRGLRTAAASTAALLALLEPLTGVILAAWLLGDRLGATGIAGMIVLATALVLAALPAADDGPGGRQGAARGRSAPARVRRRRQRYPQDRVRSRLRHPDGPARPGGHAVGRAARRQPEFADRAGGRHPAGQARLAGEPHGAAGSPGDVVEAGVRRRDGEQPQPAARRHLADPVGAEVGEPQRPAGARGEGVDVALAVLQGQRGGNRVRAGRKPEQDA